MIKNFSLLRKQAINDWEYIRENYGHAHSHDFDDDRLRILLDNPTHEQALRIVLTWIKEVLNDGFLDACVDSQMLPEDDKRIQNIKDKWFPIIEELNI